jgi:Flp pilus assembly protein CpaB
MSRRARAAAFVVLALGAAAAAAGIADGYGSSVARGYGPLAPVVVVAAELPAGKAIGPRRVSAALDVRRVPLRFVPAGALSVPGEALGLVPRTAIPAGSYMLASQLGPVRAARRRPEPPGPARRVVEISVSGADALLAAGALPRGEKVDVVVTAEPTGAGPGRTYVAAQGVPLLALGPGADGPGPGGLSSATLGLTKRQALRLIGAENFARQVNLLPGG